MKSYNDNSSRGYILEVDVSYPKYLQNIQSDILFLPERMKIDKCRKNLCNIYGKNSYVIHIKALKKVLEHRLILKKFHRVMEFNQEAWLKTGHRQEPGTENKCEK